MSSLLISCPLEESKKLIIGKEQDDGCIKDAIKSEISVFERCQELQRLSEGICYIEGGCLWAKIVHDGYIVWALPPAELFVEHCPLFRSSDNAPELFFHIPEESEHDLYSLLYTFARPKRLAYSGQIFFKLTAKRDFLSRGIASMIVLEE